MKGILRRMSNPSTRFVTAGLVAGLALNVFDGILYGAILGPDAAAAMERLGLPEPATAGMALYTALAFIVGFVAIWLYTGMRARLGAGPVTALKTGAAVWAVAYLVPFLDLAIEGIFTARMFWIAALYSLVTIPLAVLLGARVYRGDTSRAPIAEATGAGAPAQPFPQTDSR